MFITILTLLGTAAVSAADASWAILNMTVLVNMTDLDYIYPHTPISIGTPLQTIPMGVNLAGSLFAAWDGNICSFCPGNSLYDPTQSSTFNNTHQPWNYSTPEFSGGYVTDAVVIGGSLEEPMDDFVLTDSLSTSFPQRLDNGHFGMYVPPDATSQSLSIFSRLWKQGKLLDPVIGFRFDPIKTRITIGALDPSDYEGTLNWVQMESPGPSWDWYNVVKIDGLKGYNGSFIPWGSNLRAAVSSLNRDIKVPNVTVYYEDNGYTGPISGTISVWSDGGVVAAFGYPCTLLPDNSGGDAPYAALTVTINGVDYPLDSFNNMIRAPSLFSLPGVCNVAMMNKTVYPDQPMPPDIVLGQPFLRSTYLAYRFPTDDCPGFYGFAYPTGANRTDAQKAQKPSSTPTNSAKCLSLTPPTSSPSLLPIAKKNKGPTPSYSIYLNPGQGQVALSGVDGLPKQTWALPSN